MNYVFFYYCGGKEYLEQLDFVISNLKVYSNCKIIVASNQKIRDDVEWLKIPHTENFRMLWKVKAIGKCLKWLPNDARLLCSDIDVYFKCDPFIDLPDHDLLVTSRFYSHRWPINAGIIFLKPTPKVIKLYNAEFNKWSSTQSRKDWMIDQTYLNKLHTEGYTYDLGPHYNWCPAEDKVGMAIALNQLREGFSNPEVKILHLKSKLKEHINEKMFHNNSVR